MTNPATSDEQWDGIVAAVRREIATRGVRPLDEVFAPYEAAR